MRTQPAPGARNSILFLGKALGTSLDERGVFDDQAARRETSERLRRDVWMFAQIVRAFAAKAQHTPSDDRWAFVHDFQYVREFLAYFRTMGYPLLRSTDYPRFDAFMRRWRGSSDTDLVDPRRGSRRPSTSAWPSTASCCSCSTTSRNATSWSVVPFDRRAAAGALKLYISD